MNKIYQTFVILAITILPLGACGIKPGSVDAPPTVENDTFPQQYPAAK